MKKLALRVAWWVIRRLDPEGHARYVAAVREQYREVVERITPTGTPFFEPYDQFDEDDEGRQRVGFQRDRVLDYDQRLTSAELDRQIFDTPPEDTQIYQHLREIKK